MAAGGQLLHLAFAGGIREDQRDEVLDPTTGWLVLENVRQTKTGGLYKRPGHTTLTRTDLGGSSISTGRRLLASPTGAPLMCSGRLLHEYSETTDRWTDGASMSEWTASEYPVAAPGDAGSIVDVESCNDYVCISYDGSSGYPMVALYDGKSYTQVRGAEELQQEAGHVLLSFHGNYFLAFYAETSNNIIAAWYLDTTSATTINTGWVSIGDIASDYGNVANAMAVCNLGSLVGLFYGNDTLGTNQGSVKLVNYAGQQDATTVSTNSNTISEVDCDGTSGQTFWLAWDEGTNVQVQGFDAADLATVDASVATITTVSTAVSAMHIVGNGTTGGTVYAESSVGGISCRAFTTSGGVATASGSAGTLYNAQFAGKPFRLSSRYYAPFRDHYTTENQNTWTLCDITDVITDLCVAPVVTVQNGLVDTTSSPGGKVKTALLTGTTWVTAVTVKKNNLDATAAHIVEIETANAARLKGAHYGGAVHMTGGVLQSYDGDRVAEAGYIHRPSMPTTATTGTGITATTGWLYVAVFEEIDANGNVHVSGVSDPSTSTGAVTNKTVQVTVRTLTISRRPLASDTSLRIAFYRTEDGGTIYYRVGYVVNDLTSETVTYNDSTADTTLTGNSKLYRQPGVVGTSLDRRAWPHCADATEYNGMLVVATEGSVQHSGQLVSGEAPWTNPIFEVPVPGEGDVTALAAQDGTLFAFKRRSIYALSGQAPADNGSGGGFGTPRRLAVDVGCIDPRSVVVTALGVFFQSERGLEILTRAQSVQFIGQPVQDTLASYPICTAAVLDSANSLVRFELADGETSNVADNLGVGLVYDLDNNSWVSVDKRTNAVSTASKAPQGAAMIRIAGTWYHAWMDNLGYVERETTNETHGTGAWITMVAQSGWFKVSGLQGQQIVNRALLLASKVTDFDLDFQLGYDYGSFQTARSFTHTETNAVNTALSRIHLEHLAHDDADGMSVAVKLTDKTPTSGTVGNGTGAVWVALTLDITPRPGAAETYDGSR